MLTQGNNTLLRFKELLPKLRDERLQLSHLSVGRRIPCATTHGDGEIGARRDACLRTVVVGNGRVCCCSLYLQSFHSREESLNLRLQVAQGIG